jgi:Integrase core domain
MSRRGNCLDNAPMESFFASLKKEHVHHVRFRTRAEAKAAVFDYIEVFYNRQRLHSALGYRTPAEARASMEVIAMRLPALPHFAWIVMASTGVWRVAGRTPGLFGSMTWVRRRRAGDRG